MALPRTMICKCGDTAVTFADSVPGQLVHRVAMAVIRRNRCPVCGRLPLPVPASDEVVEHGARRG